jgi:peptidyl-prolyl cis-trans isomerase SurA
MSPGAVWGRSHAVTVSLMCIVLSAQVCAAAPAGGAKPANARKVEDVAALVGSTPILLSEVEDQVKVASEQLQVDLADTAASNKLHRDVLGKLVDDQLVMLEAEAQNLKVGEDEIKKAVDDEIAGNIRQMGGPDGFSAQLKKEGLTEEALRARYAEEARKQMLAGRLIQKEVKPKIVVPDDAAKRFWDENRSQIPKKPRQLKIQDLFVATKPDSIIDRRALDRALEIRGKVLAGLLFSKAAADYSDDPHGKEGGSLGRMMRGQMDRDLEAAAFATPLNTVSQPVHSRFGYHLLLPTARDTTEGWVELNHILFAVNSTRVDESAALERAQKIVQEISSGKLRFGEAVRRYSDDPDSKSRDGEMGWIPFDNVYGEMKGVADTLREGHVGGPVAGDGGYHIFKVIDSQDERNYSFDEIQDQLRQLAIQQEQEKQLRIYLDQLRQKYFVEIRAKW